MRWRRKIKFNSLIPGTEGGKNPAPEKGEEEQLERKRKRKKVESQGSSQGIM